MIAIVSCVCGIVGIIFQNNTLMIVCFISAVIVLIVAIVMLIIYVLYSIACRNCRFYVFAFIWLILEIILWSIICAYANAVRLGVDSVKIGKHEKHLPTID